jgi:hypothetical protein
MRVTTTKQIDQTPLLENVLTIKPLKKLASSPPGLKPTDLQSMVKGSTLKSNFDGVAGYFNGQLRLEPRGQLSGRDGQYRNNAVEAVKNGWINLKTDFVLSNTGHEPNIAAGLISASKNSFGDVAFIANKELGIETHQPYGHDPFKSMKLPSADELKARGVSRLVFVTEGEMGMSSFSGTDSTGDATLDRYAKELDAKGIKVVRVGLEPPERNRVDDMFDPR